MRWLFFAKILSVRKRLSVVGNFTLDLQRSGCGARQKLAYTLCACALLTPLSVLLIERKRAARTWMKWKMLESHMVASAGQTPQPQSHLRAPTSFYLYTKSRCSFIFLCGCRASDEWMQRAHADGISRIMRWVWRGDWARSSSCASSCSGAESHARPRALTRPAHATPWRRQIESTRNPHHTYFCKYLAARRDPSAHPDEAVNCFEHTRQIRY